MRKALVGLLLLAATASGTGCHELNKMERWKNEQLFGRPTCLPRQGQADECCQYEGEPGFVEPAQPIYLE